MTLADTSELDIISAFALIENLMGVQITKAEIEKNGVKIKYEKNFRVKMTLEKINEEGAKNGCN